jgi:copper homeostasis protein (lipoprotein)
MKWPKHPEMVYLADAARFTDCMSGRSYPIAMEGDFVRMQRTYLDRVSAPGSRLYVTFKGTVTDRPGMEPGSGNVRTVVVNSFIDAWPNQNCERSRADASLTNTYWRITRLVEQPVSGEKGRRDPHLLLRDVDGKQSYAATVGCNQLLGNYTVTGERIAFTTGAGTLMACPPALDTLERRLIDALVRARRWQVYANTLQFKDEAGTRIALFEAVHF